MGAAACQLAQQAWRASYFYEADRRNPYVYAQTVPNLLELVEQVQALSKISPQGNEMLIKVMAPESDYWPLPWYLRQFKHVGWWDRLPEDPSAPVMIVGSKFCTVLDEKTNKTWNTLGLFGLRPSVFLQLCVQSNLWNQYLETRK
jgi:hypothetical protein